MDKFLKKIVKNLQIVNPSRIILFGSYASDNFNEESDIDILVILDSEIIPGSYDQKIKMKLEVRKSIYELSRQVPIDLIVYTNGEFEILKKQRTSFYNEIVETGKVLYEKAG